MGRSLMIGWRKKSWNPERVPTVVTLTVCVCVCVSVRARAAGHTFWPRNLIFGLGDPWDIRKKTHFFVFRIFHFYAFYRHFFFPYITLIMFLFQATGHSFSPSNVIFVFREPCTIENWRLFIFFKFNFLRLNGSFFRFFDNFSI